MMRMLITGGAGFLGSHLCDYLLEKGHSVICVDNLLTGSGSEIKFLDLPEGDPQDEETRYLQAGAVTGLETGDTAKRGIAGDLEIFQEGYRMTALRVGG